MSRRTMSSTTNNEPILWLARLMDFFLISSRFLTICSADMSAVTSLMASCTRGAIRLSNGSPANSR